MNEYECANCGGPVYRMPSSGLWVHDTYSNTECFDPVREAGSYPYRSAMRRLEATPLKKED